MRKRVVGWGGGGRGEKMGEDVLIKKAWWGGGGVRRWNGCLVEKSIKKEKERRV